MTTFTHKAALLIMLSMTMVGCADKSLTAPNGSNNAAKVSPLPTLAPSSPSTVPISSNSPKLASSPTPMIPTATPEPSTPAKPAASTVPSATPKAAAVNVSNAKPLPADRTPYSWYYMKKKTGQVPDFPRETKSFTQDQKAVWVGTGKKVYLTIDAGGPLIEVDLMLKSLKENGVKANFFITGNNIKKNPDYLKRIVADGHFVANHTMTHTDFNDLTDDQIRKEVTDFEVLYKQIIGKDVGKYFRFPYGHYNAHNLSLVSGMGYTSVFWSTAMRDWEPRANGADDPYNDIMNNLHEGNVILMHQGSVENMQALDRICKEIKKRGFEFGLVTELEPKK